jgi:hypothetical protein
MPQVEDHGGLQPCLKNLCPAPASPNCCNASAGIGWLSPGLAGVRLWKTLAGKFGIRQEAWLTRIPPLPPKPRSSRGRKAMRVTKAYPRLWPRRHPPGHHAVAKPCVPSAGCQGNSFDLSGFPVMISPDLWSILKWFRLLCPAVPSQAKECGLDSGPRTPEQRPGWLIHYPRSLLLSQRPTTQKRASRRSPIATLLLVEEVALTLHVPSWTLAPRLPYNETCASKPTDTRRRLFARSQQIPRTTP